MEFLTYALFLFIVSLIALVWSKSKYSEAMMSPNYDLYHNISVIVLKNLSVISLILLVISIILLFFAINELTNFYDYG